jgi:hypothetical protein
MAPDRCKKCLEICKTFYGRTFEVIVKVCKESKTMKKDYKTAAYNYDQRKKGKGKRFKPIRVKATTRAGIRLSKWYKFLRVCEFLREFQFKPCTLGLKTTWLKDELGNVKIEGVIMEPEEGCSIYQGRNVECWSETMRMLEEDIVDAHTTLREKEPMETYLRLNQQTEKTLCPDL